MKDDRDPEQLYKSILATRKHFGCTILEAADRVEAMRDDLNTNGRYSYDPQPAVGQGSGSPAQSGPEKGLDSNA